MEYQSIWVGLDYGEKIIGLAKSRSDICLVFPYKNIPTCSFLEFWKKYVQENNIIGLVVGLPLDLDGNEGKSVEKVKKFIVKLQTVSPFIDIFWEDERFSSSLSEKLLLEKNLCKNKREEYRKKKLHAISAYCILRQFLEKKFEFK